MKTNTQKGSVLSIVEIIVVVILVAVGGIYYVTRDPASGDPDRVIDSNGYVKQTILDDSTNLPEPQLIGNDKDEHGCIPSAGYLWSDAKQACVRPWEENQATSSDSTVNWKTYRNEKYGFEFKYPENLKVTIRNYDNDWNSEEINFRDIKNDEIADIYLEIDSNQTVIGKFIAQRLGKNIGISSPEVISGIPAERFNKEVLDFNKGRQEETIVVYVKDNNGYMWVTFDGSEVDKVNKGLLDKILLTFKFINPLSLQTN